MGLGLGLGLGVGLGVGLGLGLELGLGLDFGLGVVDEANTKKNRYANVYVLVLVFAWVCLVWV